MGTAPCPGIGRARSWPAKHATGLVPVARPPTPFHVQRDNDVHARAERGHDTERNAPGLSASIYDGIWPR